MYCNVKLTWRFFMYDLIIIGAGPAGYTAAIYATRYNLNFTIIGAVPGGLASDAHKIENWPGIPSISGMELMQNFQNHIQAFKINIKNDVVKKIIPIKQKIFEIIASKEKYKTKSLILAMGASHRHLDIPGEEKFKGKGVSYCSACDGAFFRNKNVVIIGSGNSAFMAGVQLADIAKQVYLIFRSKTPKAMPAWTQRVKQKKNITVIPDNNIISINGDTIVKSVQLQSEYRNSKNLAVDGVFIEIGQIPNHRLIDNLNIKKNLQGYIQVNNKQQTNLPGIFAAGDITTGSAGFQQIITASSEGAIAVNSVYKYLNK